MKPFRTQFRVPIYQANVVLAVSPDILQARRCYNDFFNSKGSVKVETAWCEYDLHIGRFGLFFPLHMADLPTVAHESYHLTRRIMQWASVKDEESGALLNEWIVGKVASLMRAHGRFH